MIHDSVGCCEKNIAKLPRRQDVIDKLLKVLQLQIEAGRDHTALVQSACQLNNDFAVSLIVYDFKFSNVACIKR